MSRKLATIALSLATLLAPGSPVAAASGLPAVPLYATFGDWLLACDNGRRCEARGLGPGRADIRLRRDAGDAPALLTLTVRQTRPPDAASIDGEAIAFAAPVWTARQHDDVSEMSTADPPTVAAFLDRARKANSLDFPGGAAAPLAGLVPALARMDAVQGRVGTPTALVAARGTRRASDAPPLPPRPVWQPTAPLADGEAAPLIAAAKRRAAAVMKSSGDCDGIEKDEAHALDSSHALVALSCPVNAYQGEAFVFIVPRQGGAPAAFDTRLPIIGVVYEKLGDIVFDRTTGTLASRSRGAGLANCGWAAQWVWSDGAFRLAALSDQRQCGGTAVDDWPSLFRAASGG